MKETKKYWKGLEELNNDSDFIQNRDDEFPSLSLTEGSDSSENEGDTSRRDFLKMMGFSVAAASLVACEAPVRKVIPYINKPEEVDPGKPNYYASSYVDGSNYCSVVVKTREGRPVHLEGNTESAISQGGVDARVSASVLDLYDSSRLKTFTKAGSEIAVTDADKEISAALSSASNIRLVSQSVLSPSVQAAINEFLAAYPGAKQVKYDAVSASGLLNANGGVIPSYDFSKANIIAGFNADFLGTWISPVEFSKQYSSTRRLQKGKNAKQDISRHYQFETTLSVTGSSADYRQPIKASEEGAYLTALYNLVAAKVGATTFKANKIENATLTQLASDLLANKGKSLVVSGSNDDNVQLVVKEINALLGNEGSTLDLASPSYLKQGNDKAFNAFVKEMNAGKVDAVIFFNANPVYDTPAGASVTAGLAKVKTKISFADRADETASLVDYVCPDTHYLESWGDANPKKGSYSLIQPAISPLFKGNREAAESLLIWAGNKTPFYQYVRNYWEKALFPTQTSELLFDTYWDKVLQKGVYQTSTVATIVEETVSDSLTTQQEEIVELEETEEIEVSENSLSQSVISKITKAE